MTSDIITPTDDMARGHWEAAAPLWGRWADAMAAMADKLNQPLLDAAALAPGMRVLDLASGAGEPAFSIARRVGPDGLVVGSDLAVGMLQAAGERRVADDCAAVGFAAADMLTLPFAAASFDAVTCRFGVMFVPDVAAALADIRRVLRPGGRAAFMVWGPCADNALFAEIAAGVDEALGETAPDGGIGGLFRFADPDSLAGLCRAAGFTDVTEREIRAVRRAPLSEPFWRAALEMSFSHRLERRDGAGRAAVEAAVTARFVALAGGADSAPLPLHARVIAGTAP